MKYFYGAVRWFNLGIFAFKIEISEHSHTLTQLGIERETGKNWPILKDVCMHALFY